MYCHVAFGVRGENYLGIKIVFLFCKYMKLVAVAFLLQFPYCLEVIIDRIEDIWVKNSNVQDSQNNNQNCDCCNRSSNDILVFSC